MAAKNRPRIRQVWQVPSIEEVQPTCYTPRNPARPWLAAQTPLTEDDEDMEYVRGWFRADRQSATMASIQPPTPLTLAEKRQLQREAAEAEEVLLARHLPLQAQITRLLQSMIAPHGGD
ncbi:hypothetical protein AAKU55_005515 [Oxalobacteraceae bacterium GrIS 1.11]